MNQAHSDAVASRSRAADLLVQARSVAVLKRMV